MCVCVPLPKNMRMFDRGQSSPFFPVPLNVALATRRRSCVRAREREGCLPACKKLGQQEALGEETGGRSGSSWSFVAMVISAEQTVNLPEGFWAVVEPGSQPPPVLVLVLVFDLQQNRRNSHPEAALTGFIPPSKLPSQQFDHKILKTTSLQVNLWEGSSFLGSSPRPRTRPKPRPRLPSCCHGRLKLPAFSLVW